MSKSGHDRRTVPRSVEGADTMAGSAYKAAGVLVAGAIDTKGSSRGSRIKIRWDERAELGSPIVWVKFVVNLFSDQFYRRTLALP